MKYLLASISVFVLVLIAAIYVTSLNNYFGSNFQDGSFWLKENNSNVEDVKTYEKFTREIKLYDFIRDDSSFAVLQYEDENLDFHSITILDSIVGKSIYSVKAVDGKEVTKLLSRAEVITAFSEWRTNYTFEVERELNSNNYFVSAVYINEPV